MSQGPVVAFGFEGSQITLPRSFKLFKCNLLMTRFPTRPRMRKTSPSLPFLCMAAYLCVYIVCVLVCCAYVCVCVLVCVLLCVPMAKYVCLWLRKKCVCLSASSFARSVSVESAAGATYPII